MLRLHKVFITTGDWDGVGYEVATKALVKTKLRKNVQWVLVRSSKVLKVHQSRLKKRFPNHPVYSEWKQILNDSHAPLIELVDDNGPVSWVRRAAKLCLKNPNWGLVTGPMSKSKRWGGHTEILKSVCSVENVFMGFLGAHFNVVLVTAHVPLEKVPLTLSSSLIQQCALTTFRFFEQTYPQSKAHLAFLGLNPHAGERGLLGSFEKTVLTPSLKALKKRGYLVSGPLVPDAAFLQKASPPYSTFVALYHDQGLIPFKLVHGFNQGVHVSLGLPIVRTSVDHGTAKDIFKKNCADSGSMEDALNWAVRLLTSTA